jgi:hypothetical protein
VTAPAGEEDEFSELVDADFPRVDLVGKGANGVPRFLIAKQDESSAGLLEPGFVRSLIGKEAGPAPADTQEQVTMTGSPAALAKVMENIHDAAKRPARPAQDAEPSEVAKALAEYEAVVKAKYSAGDRKKMAGSGTAMPDESYPIADEEDLRRTIRAVGRGGSSHNAIRKHIISRARSLGKSSEIPDNWSPDGSLKEGVSKELGLDLDPDFLEPETPPGDSGSGVPGSPAWEAVDAATAQRWTATLARARAAVATLAQRELLEAVSGAGPGDADNASGLQGACDAIDYAVSVLAPFAVGEQCEAEGADVELIGKAMAGDLSGPLAAVEGFAAVTKAGRVLSAANEAAIRSAAASLNKVLSALPQAPVADDVAKEAETAGSAAGSGQASVEKDAGRAEPGGTPAAPGEKATGDNPATEAATGVEKAGKALAAVYDQHGKLVGVCDPAEITPIQDDTEEDGEDMDNGQDETDLTPAPAADAGTPASDVEKTAGDGAATKDETAGEVEKAEGAGEQPTETAAVEKAAEAAPQAQDPAQAESQGGTETITVAKADLQSLVTDAVTAALQARTPPEDVAKAADVAGMRDQFEELAARVAKVEDQPAAPKVFTNGAVPPAHMLRGQDQGSPPVDVAKAQELKKTLYSGTAVEQNQAAQDMQAMAIEALAAVHAGRR